MNQTTVSHVPIPKRGKIGSAQFVETSSLGAIVMNPFVKCYD